jgi:long-chain acyl-CoA synthetase
MNITSLLADVVKKVGTKTAIIENSQEISYADLWRRIETLSAAFYKIGIRESHRVALILPNSSEFIYCFFALLKINAIVSPLSPEFTPFELKSILDNLSPRAIISLPIFVDEILVDYPTLFEDKIIVLHKSTYAGNQVKNKYNLQKLFDLGLNQRIDTLQTNDEHPATIHYTYRGVGYPLGAILSHHNYVEGLLASLQAKRLSFQHKVLCFLPLSHVYPLIDSTLVPLISGAIIVISGNYLPRSILKTIDEKKINCFSAVPAVYNLLLHHYDKQEYDLSSLIYCITGGSYMSLEVHEEIRARMGLDVLQGYGLTECLIVAWNRHEWNKAGTIGFPLRRDFQIKIVGEDGRDKEINHAGEIVIRSPTVMKGYYNREDETYKVLKNGWFYSGDYGYLDAEGYLYYTGRKKGIVKVGGNMVDLKEVQNVLLSHPAVLEAEVYPVKDSLWGHTVAAEVTSRVNGLLTTDEIKAFCYKRLARYKVPRTIALTGRAV